MSDKNLSFDITLSKPIKLSCSGKCNAGEILALVGPSGAGKSSVIRTLAGLLKPTMGTIKVGDELWFDGDLGLWVPVQIRKVGFVFQNYALLPHLSAIENVALPLLHLPLEERFGLARNWLTQVNLTEDIQLLNASSLSGGQQQRVAVARALAREPRLLLLDEPFSAVDQSTRQDLYRLLATLRRDLNIPIILVTHNLQEAALLADHMIVLSEGQVLQSGTPDRIYRSPRNLQVADLVGIQNRFKGEWMASSNSTGLGRMKWTEVFFDESKAPIIKAVDKGKIFPGQLINWIIPNDALSLNPQFNDLTVEFKVKILAINHIGDVTLLSFVIGDREDTPIKLSLTGKVRQSFNVGDILSVFLDQTLIHVLPYKVRNRN